MIPNLKREQANAVVLYLRYKGYHWNVAGPSFPQLHRMFDDHAEKVLSTVDELAERVRTLGGVAPYSLSEVESLSKIGFEANLPTSTQQMLDHLIRSHRVVIEGLHSGFRTADDHDDPASADLFARALQLHEKLEWFLRETAVDLASVGPDLEPQRVAGGETSAGTYASTRSHVATPGELPPPLQGPARPVRSA